MEYSGKEVSKLTKILFPIIITIVAGLIAPASVSLIGFLMFGNLIRECGVLNSLSETAQKVLANLITIFLGITIASQMNAEKFLTFNTILILLLGLVAFIFDTAEILKPLPQKEDQPHDRRGGNFCFPHVRQNRSQDGTERRPAELPSYAVDRRKRVRSDSVCHSRRTDFEFLYVTFVMG